MAHPMDDLQKILDKIKVRVLPHYETYVPTAREMTFKELDERKEYDWRIVLTDEARPNFESAVYIVFPRKNLPRFLGNVFHFLPESFSRIQSGDSSYDRIYAVESKGDSS